MFNNLGDALNLFFGMAAVSLVCDWHKPKTSPGKWRCPLYYLSLKPGQRNKAAFIEQFGRKAADCRVQTPSFGQKKALFLADRSSGADNVRERRDIRPFRMAALLRLLQL